MYISTLSLINQVHAFAGKDADIVHWEQSYNCDPGNTATSVPIEQFIRQSLSLPNQPVVVFSNSGTPNWVSIQLLLLFILASIDTSVSYSHLSYCVLCVIQGASDCKTAPPLPPIPQADRTLYDTILTHPLKAVAELNNVREITSSFQAMLGMFKAYPSGECLLNAYISLIYVYG